MIGTIRLIDSGKNKLKRKQSKGNIKEKEKRTHSGDPEEAYIEVMEWEGLFAIALIEEMINY